MNVLNFGSSLGRSEMKKYYLVLFTIFLFACSSQETAELPEYVKKLDNVTVYSSNPEPKHQIGLEREQVIGNTEETVIGRVADVAVDDSGRVFIADGDQLNIKMYCPDGEFTRRLGRSGKGPGEFQDLYTLQIAAGYLYAYDRDLQREVVFSLEHLDHTRSIVHARNKSEVDELRKTRKGTPYAREDGRFLMGFVRQDLPENPDEWDHVSYTRLYYLLDNQGRISSEKLFEQRSAISVYIPHDYGTVVTPVEYLGKSLTALSNEDVFYSAWSEHFQIKVYSLEGEYQRAIYYPYKRVPMEPRSDFSSGQLKLLQQDGGIGHLPPTWPALEAMLVDDQNRLWVATIIEDFDVYRWWVLGEQGKLLARFTWPRNREIEVIKNGFVYAKETEDETGLERVVRYRMEMN